MTEQLPETQPEEITINELLCGLPPVEAFLNIELPDPLPEYDKKKGITSFGTGPDGLFDKAKIEYFAQLGVEIPPDWMDEDKRAKLVNAFSILKGIYRLKDCEKKGGDTRRFYRIIVEGWFNDRIDTIGVHNVDEITGERFDTYGIDTPLGGSNIPKKISIGEFQEVCNKVVGDLQKKD